jgi:NAD(P)-dependent dehydrogenase (short-subunit alcohol dehydrogenase family)
VTNSPAVTEALAQVRRELGPIEAVVHGAGVIADKLIAEKTDEQFDRVFATKVGGLRALLDATAQDPLRAIVVFSSVAGRFGNTGQVDYAMANEIANKVAAAEARRRGPSCLVRSIAWGPWEGGMVAPALRAHFEKRGVRLIPLALGARAFVDELRAGTREVEVVIGDAPTVQPAPATTSFEIAVDEASAPYLRDHTIEGTPVVPVVLAVEWLLRAAAAMRPGQRPRVVRDLRVLKGIRLERFGRATEKFQVVAKEEGASLALEIRSTGVSPHYSAVIDFNAPNVTTPAALEVRPWNAGAIYDGPLFHGPQFHAIREVVGASDEGGVAIMEGASALGWPEGQAWASDPALLDGGLQLARLLALKATGRPSLPSRFGSLALAQPGLVQGPVRCEVRTRGSGKNRFAYDIVFTAAGKVVATLTDVDMTLLAPAATRAESHAPR